MNHSRTSGDSRRWGKRFLRIYSYFNRPGGFVNGRSNHPPRARGAGVEQPTTGNAIRHPGEEKLSILGPTTIECFGREPGGPIVRFELNGPHGERISFPIRCGLYSAGGDHE